MDVLKTFLKDKFRFTRSYTAPSRKVSLFSSLLVIGAVIGINQTALASSAQSCNITQPHPCEQPYFISEGGDIATGSTFDGDKYTRTTFPVEATGGNNNDGTCLDIGILLFGGFNNGSNNPSPSGAEPWSWYGAASQGATFTPDTAQEIATDLNSDADYNTPGSYDYQAPAYPSLLGFANRDQNNELVLTNEGTLEPYTNQVDNVDRYGGDFGNLPCMPNSYYTTTSASPQPLTGQAALSGNTVDLSMLPGGSYSYTGNLVIHDSNAITTGTPITLAVDGTVYITSNIEYGYSFPTTSIPQFNLFVGGAGEDDGAIYINPSVTEVHGFLAAQTNTYSYFNGEDGENASFPFNGRTEWNENGQDGAVNDCATSVPAGTGNAGGSQEFEFTADYDQCNTQFNFYGSLEADSVYAERSYGDSDTEYDPTTAMKLGSPPTNASNAAEDFHYSPELWIPDANSTCSGSDLGPCLSNTYEAETSLPPVL